MYLALKVADALAQAVARRVPRPLESPRLCDAGSPRQV